MTVSRSIANRNNTAATLRVGTVWFGLPGVSYFRRQQNSLRQA